MLEVDFFRIKPVAGVQLESPRIMIASDPWVSKSKKKGWRVARPLRVFFFFSHSLSFFFTRTFFLSGGCSSKLRAAKLEGAKLAAVVVR